jgi:hypothetical protein
LDYLKQLHNVIFNTKAPCSMRRIELACNGAAEGPLTKNTNLV